MIDFKTWFDTKLTVGGHPQNYLYKDFKFDKYDYIINVSDEYQPYRPDNLFWFPLNECTPDIGINSVYAAMIILDRAFKRNLTVYLHCHAGVNRSKTVYYAFYYMKTGEHLIKKVGDHNNMFIYNCERNHLPPVDKMEKFLKMLGEDLDIEKEHHISLDMLKLKGLEVNLDY